MTACQICGCWDLSRVPLSTELSLQAQNAALRKQKFCVAQTCRRLVHNSLLHIFCRVRRGTEKKQLLLKGRGMLVSLTPPFGHVLNYCPICINICNYYVLFCKVLFIIYTVAVFRQPLSVPSCSLFFPVRGESNKHQKKLCILLK